MMLKPSAWLSPWIASAILIIPMAAGADLQSRKERSLVSPLDARIVHVETRSGRLFIAGENLPKGEGVKVWLGETALAVLSSSPSLVVAELPRTRPDRVGQLVVERGVTRAVIRGRAVEWGLR